MLSGTIWRQQAPQPALQETARAGSVQLRGDAPYERVVKRLQNRQDLSKVGWAGRHDRSGGEFAVADAHRELD